MNFEDFLEKLRSLERTAIDEFVNKYYSLIKYFVGRKISNPSDVEDLIQEIFLKIISKNLFKSFNGSTEKQFKSYIIRISLNLLFDLNRTKKKFDESLQFIDSDDENQRTFLNASDNPLDILLKKELEEQLSKAISKLPQNYRDVINYRLLNYTTLEIAEILNKPKGTIDTWISRALTILRGKLKKIESNNKGI